MGELGRMTQFKDKSARHKDNINAGLFTYPTLMAADILLYGTDLVPVGADQKQHLELSRDIAARFNGLYSDTFVVPEPYIPKSTAKVYSLTEPERKMSKSDAEDSYIALLDKPEEIRRKLRRAVTDSEANIRFDPEHQPGVSNLLSILSALGEGSIETLCLDFEGKGYGELKERTAETVIQKLMPVQAEFERLMKDKTYLNEVLKENARRAQALAQRTLRKVYKKVGLYQL